MKPSRLVTFGGVRPHTVRGMRKITKAALVGGAAAAAIAATVGVAAPANAAHYHNVTSVVSWSGVDCIAIEGPSIASNGYRLESGSLCGGTSRANYNIPNGGYAGANPIMGRASWISCATYIDGVLRETDYAAAGDGHDANCLWVIG